MRFWTLRLVRTPRLFISRRTICLKFQRVSVHLVLCFNASCIFAALFGVFQYFSERKLCCGALYAAQTPVWVCGLQISNLTHNV